MLLCGVKATQVNEARRVRAGWDRLIRDFCKCVHKQHSVLHRGTIKWSRSWTWPCTSLHLTAFCVGTLRGILLSLAVHQTVSFSGKDEAVGAQLISLLAEEEEEEEEESLGSDVKSPDVSQSTRPFQVLIHRFVFTHQDLWNETTAGFLNWKDITSFSSTSRYKKTDPFSALMKQCLDFQTEMMRHSRAIK